MFGQTVGRLRGIKGRALNAEGRNVAGPHKKLTERTYHRAIQYNNVFYIALPLKFMRAYTIIRQNNLPQWQWRYKPLLSLLQTERSTHSAALFHCVSVRANQRMTAGRLSWRLHWHSSDSVENSLGGREGLDWLRAQCKTLLGTYWEVRARRPPQSHSIANLRKSQLRCIVDRSVNVGLQYCSPPIKQEEVTTDSRVASIAVERW